MGISLRPETAAKLADLIKVYWQHPTGGKRWTGKDPTIHPQHDTSFVVVTGYSNDKLFLGYPVILDAETLTWETFPQQIYIMGANDECLLSDQYYFAIRYGNHFGNAGDLPVYVIVVPPEYVTEVTCIGGDLHVTKGYACPAPSSSSSSSSSESSE